MAQSRQALLSSAIDFLRNPQYADSPLAKRIAFLETKGLTPPEIEQALREASTGQMSPYPSGTGRMQQGQLTREFERDWRDWFIMAVIGGSVGWLTIKLAQKFLMPHLQPPTETQLEAAQKALEAKYDEAAELLKSLQLSTDAIADSLDEQKAEVEKELAEVRKAVEEMKEGEKRREEWAQKVNEQVDEVVKGLPKMLEKQATTQAQSLTDLQTELKSLKSLLVARRPTPGPTSTSTPTPSSSSALSYTIPSSSASPSGLETPSRTPSFGTRTPGIPAWQMKGNSTALAGSSSSSLASGTSFSTPVVASTVTSNGEGGAEKEEANGTHKEDEDDTSASGVLVQKEDGNDSTAAATSEVAAEA